MKTVGLITEYNPFHNGHLYHLQKSMEQSGAEYSVAVMSGNFVQRGEPALLDKWARARMAVACGVDLVIELPFVFACQNAQIFAQGAVSMLDALGIIDSICFGSESGDLASLYRTSEIMHTEDERLKTLIRSQLAEGLSHPAARSRAFIEYANDADDANDGNFLDFSPNNILAMEYLRALKKINSNMHPLTIKRFAAEHHDTGISGTIASATAIRSAIAASPLSTQSDTNDLSSASDTKHPSTYIHTLPAPCLSILQQESEAGRAPVFMSDYEKILISLLRRMTIEEIAQYADVAEGLEYKIKKSADNCSTIPVLLDSIKSKRYTMSRIKRIMTHILCGTPREVLLPHHEAGPSYIRVLAMGHKGRQLMKSIKQNADLPVITKAADYKKHHNPLLVNCLSIEAACTDQYVIAGKSQAAACAGRDFTKSPERL